MKCPFCKNTSKVIDKREISDLVDRRRRECDKCKRRFTTYEKVEQKELKVIKKDGKREPFELEKLEKGILKACEKRPIKTQDIEKVINKIETTIRRKYQKEIKSSAIGDLIMKNLQKLDNVAYIRFASVYKEFEDINSFKDEIKNIKRWSKNDKERVSTNKKERRKSSSI